MKIRGPDGPGPVKGVPVEGAGESEQAEAAELDPALEPAAPPAPELPEGVARVSAALRSGELTPAEAAEALVEAVVGARAGSLPPALLERIRAELLQLVGEDPVLAQQIRDLDPDLEVDR